jgi:hypothetical protein
MKVKIIILIAIITLSFRCSTAKKAKPCNDCPSFTTTENKNNNIIIRKEKYYKPYWKKLYKDTLIEV